MLFFTPRHAACLSLAAALSCGGCAVVTVAATTVSVAASVVGAGITVGQVAVGGVTSVAQGSARLLAGGEAN